jgi:site-specific recombinase XerD
MVSEKNKRNHFVVDKPDQVVRLIPPKKREKLSMFDRLVMSLKAQHSEATARQYLETFKEFCRLLGFAMKGSTLDDDLQAITADDVAYYINWCKSRPSQPGRSRLISDRVSPVTIKKKLTALSSCMRHAIELGIAKENPFTASRDAYQHHKGGDRRRTEMLDFNIVRTFLDVPAYTPIQKRDKAIVAALIGAGLRRAEAANLRILDLIFKPRGDGIDTYLVLRNTKAQRSANQLILQWAAPYVTDYAMVRKTEGATATHALFIAYSGRSASPEPLSGTSIYLIFKRFLKTHGIDPTQYTPHSCRATVITLLLERGKDHRTVQKFSRHGSIEMVVHYDKLRNADRPEEFEDVEL